MVVDSGRGKSCSLFQKAEADLDVALKESAEGEGELSVDDAIDAASPLVSLYSEVFLLEFLVPGITRKYIACAWSQLVASSLRWFRAVIVWLSERTC